MGKPTGFIEYQRLSEAMKSRSTSASEALREFVRT
jgi:hypothetical protein